MAFKGDYIFKDKIATGETEIVEARRLDGSFKDIERPVYQINDVEYNDVFIYIGQYEIVKLYSPEGVKTHFVEFFVDGFKSEEARNINKRDYLFSENHTYMDVDLSKDIAKQLYEYLKTLEGFKNLKDI